jgi:hypothetical protein
MTNGNIKDLSEKVDANGEAAKGSPLGGATYELDNRTANHSVE